MGGRTAASAGASERAIGITAITNLALAAISVVTGVLAARLLGPVGEGTLAAIQNWPLLLGSLAMLGLPEALVFFIARSPQRGRQFTSTAIVLALVSSLIVAILAWPAVPLLLSAQRPRVISAARVFLAIGPIYALVGIPHGALRGAKRFLPWNLLRLAPSLVWLGILLFVWAFGHPDAIVLSRLYLLGLTATGLPILFIVSHKLEGSARPDPGLAPRLLRFGLPSMLTSVPQTVNLQLDQLLIAAFLPARSLGLYVVAVSWSGAIAPLLSAVASVLFPQVSAELDADRQSSVLATALRSGSLVAVVTGAFFTILAPIGLPLVFGSAFSAAVPSALVLVPAGAVLGWAGIAEEGLRGLGRPGLVLAGEALAAAVTLAALPILLALHGVLGAALASLLGYTTVALFTAVAISRLTNQRVGGLVIPTWSTAKAIMGRAVSLLPGHNPGKRVP